MKLYDLKCLNPYKLAFLHNYSFHSPFVFFSSDEDSSDDEADEDGVGDEEVEDKWGELVRHEGKGYESKSSSYFNFNTQPKSAINVWM